MKLREACEPMFARHETFAPRYGWFRKAYQHVANDPTIFSRPDAPVLMGVGKNMVRAIRFWGWAAKLIAPASSKDRPRNAWLPTRFGHSLLSDDGWDPFLEDPGSWWLLHWRLLASPCRLPVWWVAFHEFAPVEFTEEDLEQEITKQLELADDWKKPSVASVRKDIKVMLRTYAQPRVSTRTGFEDRWDAPFRSLELLEISPLSGSWRMRRGNKPGLPLEMLQYFILDYQNRAKSGGNSITLSRLAYDPGSPGRALAMSDTDIFTRFEFRRDSNQNRNRPGGGASPCCSPCQATINSPGEMNRAT